MKVIKKFFTKAKLIALFLFSLATIFAEPGIEFTFANCHTTSDGINNYCEFDIMAAATENSQFYIAQVYFDYSPEAFGDNIVGNGNLTITKGTLVEDLGTLGSGGVYDIDAVDNDINKVSVFNTHQVVGTGFGYELSNMLGTTPQVYVHVKILIDNESHSCGISFDDQISQIELQQYYYTTPGTDNTQNYAPVTFGGDLDQPMPVELVYFNAELIDQEVELTWQTATEVNNYGFEIERKLNPSDDTEEWSKITFVAGNGTSNVLHDYFFTDNNLPDAPKVSYRLRQIDNDGTFAYSKEVVVDLSTLTDIDDGKIRNEFKLHQNFPNPFNPSTQITFSLDERSFTELIIYNVLGEKVRTLVSGHLDAGIHKVNFEAGELVSGSYIYTLTKGNERIVKKMLLVK